MPMSAQVGVRGQRWCWNYRHRWWRRAYRSRRTDQGHRHAI